MNPIAKALMTRDTEPASDHEEAYRSLLTRAGLPADLLSAARDAGLSWQTIVQLILQYGPQVVQVLQYIIAALNRGDPSTPNPSVLPAAPRRRRTKLDEPKAEGPESESAPE